MISIFNEEDIIEEMIKHSISQGLELVILDGGSTDSTYEICKNFSDKSKIKLFQFKARKWDLYSALRMTYDLAIKESPDWIVLMDADEFFESDSEDMTLKESIKNVDKHGYNLIQFDRFEFFMTDNDHESNSIQKRLTYYSHETDFIYRAWKFFPGIRNEPRGGHLPIFPDGYKYKINPQKFVCKHYRFRSEIQARKKLKERFDRTKDSSDVKIGWHSHIKKMLEKETPLVINHKLLNKYRNGNVWNYEKKFSYFTKNHLKREEIFSNDGTLKLKFQDYNELRSIIKDLRKEIKLLRNH